MRLLIQRVSSASVSAGDAVAGEIGLGLLILAGFSDKDTGNEIPMLAGKVANLRVFEDEQGKLNRSLLDAKGSILLVSQFTLYADCRKGRRPSFSTAASQVMARIYYNKLIDAFRAHGISVQTGVFGAKMLVKINNEGPVTIMLDSDDLS